MSNSARNGKHIWRQMSVVPPPFLHSSLINNIKATAIPNLTAVTHFSVLVLKSCTSAPPFFHDQYCTANIKICCTSGSDCTVFFSKIQLWDFFTNPNLENLYIYTYFLDLRCVPSYETCSYALALCTTYRLRVVAQLRIIMASSLSMAAFITSTDNRANLVLGR